MHHLAPPVRPDSTRPARPRPRRAARPLAEVCEARALLATVTLSGPGPITALTLADDGTFQVRRSGFGNGQVFPAEGAPGDAGIFVRTADGAVYGPNLSFRPRTAMGPTNAQGLTPTELSKSADGTSATLRATNGAAASHPFAITQVTTYHAGDEHFRVDTTLANPGPSPLVIDVFAAADLYLASSDKGVGYRDPATGAVGGEDVTGTYRIFVQPETAGGGLAPTSFQEAKFSALWQAIGTGGHLDGTILGPGGPAPHDADPNYLDNGAGLEWRSITIAPGAEARLAYYWSFGGQRSVDPSAPPVDPAIDASPVPDLDARAGVAFTAPVATFTVTGDPGAIIAGIDWGDGTSGPGTIASDGQGRQQVIGTHTYATTGSRSVVVSLTSASGTSATATSTVRVSAVDPTTPPTVAVTGALDPASDSGASNADGITNVTRPTFRGRATPGAMVALTATPAVGAAVPLGTATADAAGAWAVTPMAALADATYQVHAAATLGGTTATAHLAPLVIDTVAPTAQSLTVDPRTGRIGLELRDAGAGLDPRTLAELANFQLVRAVSPRPVPIGLNLADAGVQAAGTSAMVRLRTTSGRIGHGLRYQFRATSGGTAGVRDLAGNALDGEYRGRFASGNGQAGGDFRIGIATDGVKVLPYQTVPSAPTGPARVARRRGR